MSTIYDCVIIGGGPAGLSAAIYAARFRRRTLVIDRGNSRASFIPMSHNLPGFPDGISGLDILSRLRHQAEIHGTEFRGGEVTSIQPMGANWRLRGNGLDLVGRTVLFATGVVDRRPNVSDQVHDTALASGKLRYCPVCDGFEAGSPSFNARIGVVGASSHGVAEAVFLRRYSDRITLFTEENCELDAEDREKLSGAGISWVSSPVKRYDFSGDAVEIELEDERSVVIDTLYPAFGSKPNNELLKQLGIRVDEESSVPTDKAQRLGLDGLYAAGDLVSALDQISVAMGHAAIAATAMHNELTARESPEG